VREVSVVGSQAAPRACSGEESMLQLLTVESYGPGLKLASKPST